MLRKRSIIISVLSFSLISVFSVEAQIDYIVPQWVKKNAGWWSQGQIGEDEFISGLKYLIDEKIIVVPPGKASSEAKLPFVPHWIKDTAGWWADGKVSDADFVNGIQYMISNGYMSVAEPLIECKGSKMCLRGNVDRIIDGDTIKVEGYTIRLSLTNTPETYQDGFRAATVFTESLCPVGSKVVVDQDDLQPTDKYQRILGKVLCQGKNLNAELLTNGHASILTQYCSTSEFANEDWAKKNGC